MCDLVYGDDDDDTQRLWSFGVFWNKHGGTWNKRQDMKGKAYFKKSTKFSQRCY